MDFLIASNGAVITTFTPLTAEVKIVLQCAITSPPLYSSLHLHTEMCFIYPHDLEKASFMGTFGVTLKNVHLVQFEVSPMFLQVSQPFLDQK